ncbi:MAG: hypothetical protein ACI9CP_001087 [Cryomorphaceae bacterium]|jgi:hypothetical protein
MKALIAAFTLALMLGGQSFASGISSDEGKTKKKSTENRELLSPELAKLFKEGKLAETIVKPMYTSTDQLVNTEMIKKAKQK